MLIYALVVLVLLLLILLFRYLPHRIFIVFVALAAVLCAIVVHMQLPERAPAPLTQEQRTAIARDQDYFMPWWAAYQKHIAELDRNWTSYHQILTDAKEGNTRLSVTYERLVALEKSMQDLRSRIEKNAPPIELSDAVYDHLAAILSATDDYAAAQQKAITLTRAAADPATIKEKDPAQQGRLLELVMLRESPVALFIEDDIAAIRDYFAPISPAHHVDGADDNTETGEKNIDK